MYGLAGLGLVLTYKTSGIFNFGYGAVAALNVFCFYILNTELHLEWAIAALISVGVFAPQTDGPCVSDLSGASRECGHVLAPIAAPASSSSSTCESLSLI